MDGLSPMHRLDPPVGISQYWLPSPAADRGLRQRPNENAKRATPLRICFEIIGMRLDEILRLYGLWMVIQSLPRHEESR